MTKQRIAESALLMTTLIWGSTFVAMKVGLRDMSPVLMTGVRFTLASLVFLVVFRRTLFPVNPSAIAAGVLLGLFLFLGFIAQNIGLVYTTASKSSFLTSLMVVFVPVIQLLVERRAPTWGNCTGIVVVLAGLYLLTAPAGAEFNVGDALTLLCAILFAFYIVYLDVASKKMSTPQLSFLQSIVPAVLGISTAFLFEDVYFHPTTSVLVSVGYLTVFATVITTFVQTRYQKDTTPTRAAIIFTIEPVWASLFAYAYLDEHIGIEGVIGGGLILCGILLSELSDIIPGLDKPVLKAKQLVDV